MWKAFLLLGCVLGSTATISCEDTTNPAEDITPGHTESTVSADGTSTDLTRTSRCGGYPPICPKNEVYYNCSGGCIPRLCSEIGFPLNCNKKCTPGCVCKDSYVRTDNGTCIPIPDCPSCGGDKNAQQGCGNNCGRTCSDYNKPKKPCPPGCIFNGCNCRKGFVYDNNVKCCIKPEECTKCDKPNEVYDVCPAPCPPKRCNVDERVIDCAPPPKPGDPGCMPGCRCADKYYRNATGTCVLKKNCEKPLNCVGPNEVYDACPAICPPQECGVNPAVILCMRNPEYGDLACRPSCVCRDGYVRNDAKKCIPKDKCPKCDGLNEYWEKCIQGCSNQTCDSINQTYFCPYQKGCKSGCRCSPGFYRNGSNVCVPEDECPKTCGKNEHWEKFFYSCGGNESCEDIGKGYSCPAQQQCRSGCRCDIGYWRNTHNVCIPESECPTPPCPSGEVYSRCPTVKCEGDYCPKTRDSPLTCPVGIVCDQPRCVCGLLDRRDRKTGKCIRSSDCPPFKCDGPNEEYQSCPATCPGEECTDYINGSKCPPFRIGIVVPCKPQCRCTKGYYRNSYGICILASQCGS